MHRPAWVEVDLNAIRSNLLAIQEQVGPQVKIMGIVKADAYGHGDYEVSRVLVNNGVSMLGIAIPEEGIFLREKGIKTPVLLLGGFFEGQIETIIHYNITPAIYDFKLAEILSKKAEYFNKIINVHVYVDSGMGSIGVKYDKAIDFIGRIIKLKNLFIEGIYTHCACSDEKDNTFTGIQLRRFNDILTSLNRINVNIPLQHMANSGAILSYPDTYFNMVRPGISLYGLYPSDTVPRNIKLVPAMTFKTRVIHIKDMVRGDFVGYGGTYIVSKPMRIATVPVGYYDGYNRLFSNRGEVLIRGKRAPIVGRVCMDQFFVDVSNINDIAIGDEVVLYGSQGKETVSIELVAKQLQTIPYEVTCNISKRVPRIYFNRDN